MDIRNDFLLRIGLETRKNRISFWNDQDTVSVRAAQIPQENSAGLWFRTQGCTYDAQGGCIMCDYSNGPKTSVSQMISYVASGLKDVPEDCVTLLVSPSGSMFDCWEVPREALTGILHLLQQSAFKRILFETRAETITEDTIALCRQILGERFYGVYMGLEAASPFLLKYCINKQLSLHKVQQAIDICRAQDVAIIANVLVGIPFLNAEESVTAAAETVQWALARGASGCDLFPVHIKKATPLEVLYREGIYSPPSLWELAEVITRLEPDTWPRIGLSWYTSNGAYNIICSPATCPSCQDTVIECLKGFADTHKAEFVHAMNSIKCQCRQKWKNHKDDTILSDRIIRGYAVLARQFLSRKWWEDNLVSVCSQIWSDWENTGGWHVI